MISGGDIRWPGASGARQDGGQQGGNRGRMTGVRGRMSEVSQKAEAGECGGVGGGGGVRGVYKVKNPFPVETRVQLNRFGLELALGYVKIRLCQSAFIRHVH